MPEPRDFQEEIEFPRHCWWTRAKEREKSIWIGTNGGLCRWIDGKVQKLPVTDTLASASILSLFEDREGNLWVGTETGGLHILRDERFRTVGTHEGLSSDDTTTVVEDGAGVLWVGTRGSGLNAVTRDAGGTFSTKTYSVRNGLPSDVILSLASASNGDLWVGTPDGLGLSRHGHIDSFTSAERFCLTTLCAPFWSMPMARCGWGPEVGLDDNIRRTFAQRMEPLPRRPADWAAI